MRVSWLVLAVAAAMSTGAAEVAAASDEGRESESLETGVQVAPRERPKLTPWRIFPAAGKFRFDAYIFGDLERDSDLITLGPDVWYGVSDGFALGVVHSGYGSFGFYGLPGAVCLNECGGDVYNNFGIRGLARLYDGDFALAADAGVLVDWVGSTQAALRAGVTARLRQSWFRLDLNPTFLVALNERGSGADDFLLVPVTASVLLTPELRLDVQSGYLGPLQDFGDSWAVPITVGGAYDWYEHLIVGLRASYFELSGNENAKSLEFFVSVGY